MKPKYRIANQEYEASPVSRGNPVILDINSSMLAIENIATTGTKQRFTINGCDYEAHVVQQGNDIFVHLDGEHWQVEAINAIEAGGSSASSDAIAAPMPGTVVSVKSKPGDSVLEGTTLLTIESMKLQTAIITERVGIISQICFAEGDTFNKGDVLIRFEGQGDD